MNTSRTKISKEFEARPFPFQNESKIFSKGKHGVQNYARKDGYSQHHSSDAASEASSVYSSQMSVAGKVHKKHGNKGKKEKLRRLHRDLDRHSFN